MMEEANWHLQGGILCRLQATSSWNWQDENRIISHDSAICAEKSGVRTISVCCIYRCVKGIFDSPRQDSVRCSRPDQYLKVPHLDSGTAGFAHFAGSGTEEAGGCDHRLCWETILCADPI